MLTYADVCAPAGLAGAVIVKLRLGEGVCGGGEGGDAPSAVDAAEALAAALRAVSDARCSILLLAQYLIYYCDMCPHLRRWLQRYL
jgi:hypothetical protein